MRVIDRLPLGCSGRPLTMIWEETPGQGGMGKRCGTLYPERGGMMPRKFEAMSQMSCSVLVLTSSPGVLTTTLGREGPHFTN